jgi:hypothetical protein
MLNDEDDARESESATERRHQNYENYMSQKREEESARQKKTKQSGGVKALTFKPKHSQRASKSKVVAVNNDYDDQVDTSN